MTGKYQWPASRLGDKEMALLFQEKQKAKMSICELLRRAVNIAYGGMLEKAESRTSTDVLKNIGDQKAVEAIVAGAVVR